MIKSNLTKVSIPRFPRLNDRGVEFYGRKDNDNVLERLQSLAGVADVPVNGVSFDRETGGISMFTIDDPATGEHLTTIFDYYFDGDIKLTWSF